MNRQAVRVLVVDDSPDDVTIIRAFLSQSQLFDYQIARVQTAPDIRQALTQPLDIVLLDLVLPNLSWQDALALVRQAQPELPVVVVSGYVTPEREAEMAAAGVAICLHKYNIAGHLLLEALPLELGKRWGRS